MRFQLTNGISRARRTALLAGVLIAGSCALCAQADGQAGAPQDGQPGMHRRGHGMERELGELTHALTLSESQQAQVKTLLAARQEQMEALRKPAAGSDAPRPGREQMEALHQATDTKIAALLNDDQKAKFATWQKQRQERMQHRRGADGQEGPPQP